MAKLRNLFKKHLIPNLESKCRLCLSDKAIVHSIFQSDQSKEATDTLVEKIFECTAIMLSKDYDFPSPICEDCALKLDEFLLFRTKCLRSNEIYRFNRLHKLKLLGGAGWKADSKPPLDDSGGHTNDDSSGSFQQEQQIPVCEPRPVPSHSSSEDGAQLATVINSNQIAEEAEDSSDHHPSERDNQVVTYCNGKQEDEVDALPTSQRAPSPPVLLIEDTEVTTPTESLPASEDLSESTELFEPIVGFLFPLETIEDLERLECQIRACDKTREQFVDILRNLKTHDTSLSETYQRLFTDALLIHYNYDGISPKYNKRPLKTLAIFTDCMYAAWSDLMDVGMIKDAIIEAVRKSHNRYNQCNHRKRASYEWL